MITSKLTSKSQTTVPQPVRRALRLSAGDQLRYEIEGDRVILTKSEAENLDDPFLLFDEWRGDPDQEDYAEL